MNRAPVDSDFQPPAVQEGSARTALSLPADDLLSNRDAFRNAMEMATLLAKSQLIPPAFRNKPEDVFAAYMLARKMGEDLFTVLNAVHFVNGKPGWNASFLIARANASGVFSEPLSFDTTGEGASLAVTCSATIKATGRRVSKTISMAIAKAEGWTKNGKYANIGEQMLSYRAATFLIRLHCPGILYGYRPVDELEDIEANRGRTVTSSYEDPPPSPASSSRPAPMASRTRAPLPLTPEAPTSAGVLSPSPVSSPVSPRGDRQPASEAGDLSAVPSGAVSASPPDRAGVLEGDGSFEAASLSSSAPEPHALDTAATVHESSGSREAVAAPAGETRGQRAKREATLRRREESEADREARRSTHHSSWEKARPGFGADLTKLGIGACIDSVSAWCEAIGKPTPSHRDNAERAALLKALTLGKARREFVTWAEELVEDATEDSADPIPPAMVRPSEGS